MCVLFIQFQCTFLWNDLMFILLCKCALLPKGALLADFHFPILLSDSSVFPTAALWEGKTWPCDQLQLSWENKPWTRPSSQGQKIRRSHIKEIYRNNICITSKWKAVDSSSSIGKKQDICYWTSSTGSRSSKELELKSSGCHCGLGFPLGNEGA